MPNFLKESMAALIWNFQWGGGGGGFQAKKNTFHGRGVDIFWNNTMTNTHLSTENDDPLHEPSELGLETTLTYKQKIKLTTLH